MFLKACWYVAAWSTELQAGKLLSITIIGEPIVIYRATNGEAVALEDRCCHRLAPLSLGRQEGDDLRCMYHGMKFNRQGLCVEIPGQSLIPPKARVRSYAVVERHGWLWVWMAEQDAANPDLIPAAIGPENSKYNLRSGNIDYAANYQLINDNLTDFTHLSYVHPKSFGTSEEFARTRPKITALSRGIRVQRWVLNAMIDPNDQRPERGGVAGNELWQTYDFLAPGVLLMYNGVFAPGSAASQSMAEPAADSPALLNCSFTSQAVTPMTEGTSRYFFSWGPNVGEGSDAMADMMMSVALMAFGEDKTIIEAQQRNIQLDPTRRELLTSSDAGPVRMRRMLDELIAAEQNA